MGEGFGGLIERELFADQIVDANFSGCEQAKRGFEAAAAGADQRDFVDDRRSGVDGDEAVDGRLHDDGSARDAHRDRGTQAFGRAGGVDDDGKRALGEFFGDAFCVDGGTIGDFEFFFVAAEEVDVRSGGFEDLRDQKAEFSVAEDGDVLTIDFDLIEDFAGGGNGFDEDGVIGGDGRGDAMEIGDGQGEKFGEGAGVVDDAENGAIRAVAAEFAAAPFALAAGEIDFAGDSLADPIFIFGFDDDASELVAGSAAEVVVAALEFEVGGADSGGEHADFRESFTKARRGSAAKFDTAGFKMNGEHVRRMI